jgi:hypothetical protein
LLGQIRKHGEGRVGLDRQFEQVAPDIVISSTSWGGEQAVRERFQVIRFCDGKIVDVQGCASRRTADRFARRRSAR